MTFTPSQTVYRCREYEEVTVPIRNLLAHDGTLEVYPEVSGHGYFDIDYVGGKLVLKAKGFVGLIPISNRVAIHVEPRAPIGNLLYMVWRAGGELKRLEGFVRGYQEISGSIDNPEEIYVATFQAALNEISKHGLLKTYEQRLTERERRGRLLVGRTVSRFRSRGIRFRHAFELNELTVNNRANQIVKFTAARLLRHLATETRRPKHDLAKKLSRQLDAFSLVDTTGITREVIARESLAIVRSLPRKFRFYESAVWLSYLIATKSGVIMEQIGRAQFESVIIDAATVFENYIRALCKEAVAGFRGGCALQDGNKRPVPLFVGKTKYVAQPDYYFTVGNVTQALADSKYKPNISAADRYELLAFCEACNVRKAAFVCPIFLDRVVVQHQGTTLNGKEIHMIRIDLAAQDIALEEANFRQLLGTTLDLLPRRGA